MERRVAATRLAARLLFGAETPDPVTDDLDETTFVEVVLRNKAPVAVVEDAVIEATVPSGWERARAHVARERRRLETARAEYTAIAAAWAAAGITAVLIKSPGYFPYTSDNVDVLVPSAAAARARSVLEDAGYRELPWAREPFKILLRKVDGDPAGFAVHLHTRVAWINSFLEAAEVVGTSEPFGREALLRRPGPEIAFLITTAHWFYEDKEVKLRDLYHSREILRADLDWDAVLATARHGGWGDGLTIAVGLLRAAAAELGLGSLAERLPSLPPVASRLAPGFGAGATAAALPAQIDRRKAKAMHLVKSLRNPAAGLPGRVREAALVGAYAVMVRFPALLRAPLFVVDVPEGAGTDTLAAAIARAAGTLRTVFHLPVEVHDGAGTVSPSMVVRGGIHVLRGSGVDGRRRSLSLRRDGDGVALEAPASGEREVVALDEGDEVSLAAAVARAYLGAIR